MKVRPMLGEFELTGIEQIESSERRALVAHRVPGLAGDYLQDLGTAPNHIVIRGSRAGDDARDAFLTGIRELFNTGAPTTFVADINTATDLVDVLIDDLELVEHAGGEGVCRYAFSLRKYTKPPEPPAAGFPGLDTSILDDAMGALNTLEALDALASLPDLGDPTGPLLGALDGVQSATSGLDGLTSGLSELFG
jgi:hypothetical protein